MIKQFKILVNTVISRIMSSDTDYINIFDGLQDRLGFDCYQSYSKLKRLRTELCQYIRANRGYRQTLFRVIQDALDYHSHHCEDTVALPAVATYRIIGACRVHSVLILAAHLCQKFDLVNTDGIVSSLLNKCCQCDGGFDRFVSFLDPLTFPFEVDPLLFPFDCVEESGRQFGKSHLKVLEYFLKASVNLQVPVMFSEFDLTVPGATLNTFESNVPVVNAPLMTCRGCTPLLLACHSTCPHAVLMLLRYGADPLKAGQVHLIVGLQFQHPLYVIITKLNASVFWRHHNQRMDPLVRDQFIEKQVVQEDELKQCLRYFGRALPRLPIMLSNRVQNHVVHNSTNPTRPFLVHPSFDYLIPSERTNEPAELTHQCRLVVRHWLQDLGRLPSGIADLPLPKLIKKYLDLIY